MLVWFFLACPETEQEPVQFNAQDESLEVHVGVATLEDSITRTLNSSTGLVEVANAEIDPGGAPFGTIHQVRVQLLEEYQEAVKEVYVDIDSGSRGIRTYMLVPDSAQPSLHVINIESIGEEDETRYDAFTFRLISYQEVSEASE